LYRIIRTGKLSAREAPFTGSPIYRASQNINMANDKFSNTQETHIQYTGTMGLLHRSVIREVPCHHLVVLYDHNCARITSGLIYWGHNQIMSEFLEYYMNLLDTNVYDGVAASYHSKIWVLAIHRQIYPILDLTHVPQSQHQKYQ
jgi:hypothetical protein